MNDNATSFLPTEAAPVLSVVVLCYNQENYIGDCLQSILDQELDVPFEVIVGDDNSVDKSLEVIENFRARWPTKIKVVAHQQNSGFSANLARSLAMATGEYIANIDGDDIMLPGKLKRQLEFLKANPEFGVVVHKMRAVHVNTLEPVPFPLPRRRPAVFNAEYIVENGPFFYHSSEMYRASLRRRNPVDLNVKVVADVAHLLHVLYDSRACHLDEELGLYRVNPNGATSNVISNPQRHRQNIDDMLYTFQMAEGLGIARDVVDRGRANLYLNSAIFYLERGCGQEFVECIEASTRLRLVGAKQGGLYLMRHWPHALQQLYTNAKYLLGRQRIRS